MGSVDLGKLTFVPVGGALDLVGDPVRRHIEQAGGDGLWVSEIDPDLADTAAFCEHYDVGLDVSANCVVVEAKRADRVWYAACMVWRPPAPTSTASCANTLMRARFRSHRWTPRYR